MLFPSDLNPVCNIAMGCYKLVCLIHASELLSAKFGRDILVCDFLSSNIVRGNLASDLVSYNFARSILSCDLMSYKIERGNLVSDIVAST